MKRFGAESAALDTTIHVCPCAYTSSVGRSQEEEREEMVKLMQ